MLYAVRMIGERTVSPVDISPYGTVCLGKTKTLGVLKGLSTDHFGIIKRAKHSEGDHWKSAFEWEPKDNLEESSHFQQCQSITMLKY